jgi:hypothetical protein
VKYYKKLIFFSLGWQPGFHRSGTWRTDDKYQNDTANPIFFKFKIKKSRASVPLTVLEERMQKYSNTWIFFSNTCLYYLRCAAAKF